MTVTHTSYCTPGFMVLLQNKSCVCCYCSLLDAGRWQTGFEFPVNGIHSAKELRLLLGSNLCTNPGADLAIEQRPQPLEQSWKKGQAHCVLIPLAPHSLLDKAARLPEIPAGWVRQLGNLSRLPADLCCQTYSRMGFLKVLSFQEGEKYPWAEHPNSLGTSPGVLSCALLVW